MGKCKDCASWVKYFNEGFKVCDRWTDMDIEKDPETLFEVGADAADDTNLSCWLQTGPDFGCIHFKPKA